MFLLLDDQRFGREEEAGDRRCVLQCGPGDLRRVDDAGLHEVLVRVREGVVAERVRLGGLHLLDDDGTFTTGVLDDHADRLFDGATDDRDTDVLFRILELEVHQRPLGADEGDTAAGHDAFLDCRARGVQCVFDTGLLLLHLGFRCGADIHDGHATRELRQTLLELFLVVIGGALLDRSADFLLAALDLVMIASAVDDRRVVLVDHDALRLAQVGQRCVLELEAHFVADDIAGGQHGDVLQHGLATITEARRLHGGDLQRAAELVHDQRGKRLTFDVLGDDHERLARLGNLLEHREQFLHRADLLVVDQDEAILEDDLHLLRIGDEVRRDVAAIELHAVNRLQRRLETLGLFNRDDAVLADLLHRISDQVADFLVVVRRNRGNLRDFLLAVGRHGNTLQFFDDLRHGLVDAALQGHRVHAGRHVLQAFAKDRLRQDGRRRGAVAGIVAGLGRDFLHHLRAHVLERIGQLDFLRNGNAVLGDGRCAELLVDDDVATLGAERHLHGVSQLIDAALERCACVNVEMQFLGSHLLILESDQARTASTSDSRRISTFSASIVTSVPLYLPYSTRSPTFTVIGTSFPSSYLPGPTATISPCWGFSLAVSGIYSPPRICSASSSGFTTTRSANGVTLAPMALLVVIVLPPDLTCDICERANQYTRALLALEPRDC